MNITPTTSEKMISECNEQIAALQKLKAIFKQNEVVLNKFSHSSSVGTGGTAFMIFLHDPPAEVKDFCRAVGGRWTRETSHRHGEINYVQDNEFRWTIFGAEVTEPPKELAL